MRARRAEVHREAMGGSTWGGTLARPAASRDDMGSDEDGDGVVARLDYYCHISSMLAS